MFKELDQDNLQDIIKETENVFVQYGAGWCGNCKIMKPKFKKAAQEIDWADFYYVDAEKFPESRKLANVSNLPTFAFFKLGELTDEVQTNKATSLSEFINNATTER